MVGRNAPIRGPERQACDQRLRHEEAIERIGVKGRKSGDMRHMFTIDRQFEVVGRE